MNLSHATNPVGGDSLNIRKLQEFCSLANGNFGAVQSELTMLRLDLNTAQHVNKKLTQLLNWIATTNPQILDEFQTTANAFEKLAPRTDGVDAGPSSPA